MDVDTGSDEWAVPIVESEDAFELCRAVKDKGTGKEKSRWTGRFERLDKSATVKASLVNWETLYVQFRDSENGEWCSLCSVYRMCVVIIIVRPLPTFHQWYYPSLHATLVQKAYSTRSRCRYLR